MIKKLTCIECPKGCALTVDVENCRVRQVSGNECPRGKIYAESEIENPVRILTSTVLTKGLSLKMAPVRTDRPMPKAKLPQAMREIKKIRIKKPLGAGEIIVENFLGLKINLVATRDVADSGFTY